MKKILHIFGCDKGKVRKLTGTPSEKDSNIDPYEEKNDTIEKEKNENNIQMTTNEDNNDNNNKEEAKENKENEVKEIKEEVKVSPIQSNTDIKKIILSSIDTNDTYGNTWLLPKDSHLINENERQLLDFTPNFLGRFTEILDELPGFKCYHNKKNLEVNIKLDGSPLNSEFCLIKTIYTQKKSQLGLNANIDNILRLIYRVEDRLNWDKALKMLKRYEGDDKMYVVRTWVKSIVFFISEREGIEKRMSFTYKGARHVFSTSVNENYIPPEEGVVRIINYIDIFKITEDEENIYFTSYIQSDFKMPIPQNILNITLPTSTIDWFVKLQKAAEKITLAPI